MRLLATTCLGCGAIAFLLLACDGGDASGQPADGGPDAGSDAGADVAAQTDTLASTETADDASSDAAAETTDAAGDAVEPPPGKVRFVHISDIHAHGAPAAAQLSHVEQAMVQLDAVDFDASFLVATGDLVDYLPDGLDPAVPATLHAALAVLEGAKWPLRAVVGNHEYYRNEQLEPTLDKAARDAYLAAVHGRPLDYAFDEQGVRFLAISSMGGDRWENSAGLVGSFSDDQLTWLRGQLAEGRPTVLFMHHPPAPGILTPSGDSLCDVVTDHPGAVVGLFAGHLHGFWQGDFCGAPYFLVGHTDPDQAFHLAVEVDGAARTITLVNEAELPFGDQPDFSCEPGDGPLVHPTDVVGTQQTAQVVHIGTMLSNLPGLEGFDGDAIEKFPPLLAFESFEPLEPGEPGAGKLHARVSFGNPEAGFVGYVDGAPCTALTFDVAGDCVVSESVSLVLDAVPLVGALLNIAIEPSWQMRIDISSLWIEAHLAGGGAEAAGGESAGPVLDEGLIHIAASGTRAREDLETVLVEEYCDGHLVGCEPGSSAAMPPCPAAPEDCDTEIGGMSLRFVLLFLSSYPLDNIVLVGELHTEARPLSATPLDGAVDETIFSSEPGSNCAN